MLCRFPYCLQHNLSELNVTRPLESVTARLATPGCGIMVMDCSRCALFVTSIGINALLGFCQLLFTQEHLGRLNIQ